MPLYYIIMLQHAETWGTVAAWVQALFAPPPGECVLKLIYTF